jgi:hypothetical protein
MSKEATSSSPSGRHIGHYKAIIKDPVLVSLHTAMMSIPFQVGIAPERWTKVTDIMLEKEAGNPRSHRLCILALFECDFNQSKRILRARKTAIIWRIINWFRECNLVPDQVRTAKAQFFRKSSPMA